jgi:hypothetical protein
MGIEDKSFRSYCINRLHKLQHQYARGQIRRGSKDHREMLVLEELESLVVGQQTRQYCELKSLLLERANGTNLVASVSVS